MLKKLQKNVERLRKNYNNGHTLSKMWVISFKKIDNNFFFKQNEQY